MQFFSMFCLLFALCFFTNATAAEQALDVDEIIQKALQLNYKLQQRKSDVRFSEIGEWSSWKKLYLPDVNLALTASDFDTYNGSFTDAKLKDPNPYLYQLELRMKADLFNGFQDYYNHQISLNSTLHNKSNHDDEMQNLVFQIRSKFLDLSLGANQIELLQGQLKRDEELFRLAQKRFRNGLIKRSDLQRSRINLLTTKEKIIAQKKNQEGALLELNNIVGSKVQFDILPLSYIHLDALLQKFLDKLKNEGIAQLSQEFYSKYLTDSYHLQTFQYSLMNRKHERSRDKSGYYPKLTLESLYNYNKQKDRLVDPQDRYVVQLNLRIPIFDSFDTYLKAKQNRERVVRADLELQRQQFEVKNQIRQLLISILNDQESYALIKDQYELRKSIYESTLRRYKGGVVSTRFVLEDKNNLDQTEFSLASVSNRIRKNYLEIRKISGEDLLGEKK